MLVSYVKILKISEETAAENKASLTEKAYKESNRTLTIKGFTESGEVLFQYNDKT